MAGAKISDCTLKNQRLLSILAVYPPLQDQAGGFGKPCSDHFPPLIAVGCKLRIFNGFAKHPCSQTCSERFSFIFGGLGVEAPSLKVALVKAIFLHPSAHFCTGGEMLAFAA